jgi:DnaJ-domain-containing protein 1
VGANTIDCRVAHGAFVRLLYRLGHQQASGILTITAPGVRELFALRRGGIVVGDELAKRTQLARLTRLASFGALDASFEGGISSYPPGAQHVVALAAWARAHLEAQLESSLADKLVRELAGMRLSIKSELAPAPNDEADRRVLAAMAQPRRLDQIAALARIPKFRMLAFVWFLRSIDALEVEGIVAERSAPNRLRPRDPAREAAARLLGLDDHADVEAIKRAYRRIARSLHPDLQPDADDARRKSLERRFAEVTAAYELLA